MTKRFETKRALVTGASRGIGKAIALRLASEGAEIVIHYHQDDDEAAEVAALIAETGGDCHLIKADLSDPDQAIRLASESWEMLNGIDILINNAGISAKKHFLDTTPQDVDYFTDVNFKSSLFLTQAIAKQMVANQISGSIFTITSINAIQPGVGLSLYGATKAALETLMKGVALELAPHAINVNTIALGAIATDMNAEVWQNAEKLKLVTDHIPLGRLGEAHEIASIVVDLVYSGAYMTGSTIKIDGGWQMQQGYIKSQPYQ